MKKYLYNDIELPALPSVDTNIFPYAIILPIYTLSGWEYVFSGKYSVRFLASDVLHMNSVGNLTVKDTNADLRYIYYETDGTEWTGDATVKQLSAAFTSSNGVTWANYDILNADGTIYLAASDPIPVPEWTPKDTYHRVNGEWQKGTFYKRVNNAWVKHQAYRRVNGAWVKVKE